MKTIQLLQAANALRQFPGRTLAQLATRISANPDILRAALETLADDGQAHCLAGRWYPGSNPDHLPSDLLRAHAEVMAGLPVPVDPNQNQLFAQGDA